MAFDLMSIMSDASKASAEKPAYEQAEISIDDIIENPANSKIYTTEGIDKLAASIELAGKVLQNLVVKAADENGKYMLISGHRRWMACRQLVEHGEKEQFGKVTCLIENEQDELMQELMLIYTNSTGRVLTDAEKIRQAERATAICKELKEANQLQGRVRDIVAEMLHESKTQLARYSAISNNLTNQELKDRFESGKMGISAAYEASKLSEEGQQKLAEENRESESIPLQKVTVAKMQERDHADWQGRLDRMEEHRRQEAAKNQRAADAREEPEVPEAPSVEPEQTVQESSEAVTAYRARMIFARSVVRNDLTARLKHHQSLVECDLAEHNEEGAANERAVVDYYDKLIQQVEREIKGI